jgi:CHAT domain-containing protein
LPVRSHEWPHRLTPELVMTSPGLFLDGTTVVLQGCVSGLAEEGLADALGLEWALLAKGATMVLASHWDVDYRSAGAFCRHFHQAWLHQGVSRIAAWREAVTRTRMDPEGGSPDDWAAFSLAGDWR